MRYCDHIFETGVNTDPVSSFMNSRILKDVEYLEHNSYLQEQIDQKDRQIKYARLDDMVREVYD